MIKLLAARKLSNSLRHVDYMVVRQRRRQKRSIDELGVEQRSFLATRGDTGAGKDTSSPSTVVSCARSGTEQAVPTISASSSCLSSHLVVSVDTTAARAKSDKNEAIHPLTKTNTPQRRTGTRLTKTSKLGGERGPRGLLSTERFDIPSPKSIPHSAFTDRSRVFFSAHM